MDTITVSKNTKLSVDYLYPLLTKLDRLSAWERARGILNKHKLDPIKELKKMRKEWERKLPKIK